MSEITPHERWVLDVLTIIESYRPHRREGGTCTCPKCHESIGWFVYACGGVRFQCPRCGSHYVPSAERILAIAKEQGDRDLELLRERI